MQLRLLAVPRFEKQGTDTCGEKRKETEIGLKSVCLCACGPRSSPCGGSNLPSPFDFAKFGLRAHSWLATVFTHTTAHTEKRCVGRTETSNGGF